MTTDIKLGLDSIQEAIAVRAEITAAYGTYAELSKIVQVTALVDKADFKNAVDALYYFGGGWPSPSSKGRLERALDHVAGMYRLLSLIGKGDLVEKHLAQKGISISLTNPIEDTRLLQRDIKLLNEEYAMKQFGFKPAALSELVACCIKEAMELQGFICKKADTIKHELKPKAKDFLQVEDEEYDRLVVLKRLGPSNPEKVLSKKHRIESSVSGYREAAKGP